MTIPLDWRPRQRSQRCKLYRLLCVPSPWLSAAAKVARRRCPKDVLLGLGMLGQDVSPNINGLNMPYKTRFERQKSEWITLAQAVEHVASVENHLATSEPEKPTTAEDAFLAMDWLRNPSPHSPAMNDALSQVRAALQDGEIPIKWAQDRWPQSLTFIPGELFAFDDPPSGLFWQYAEIDYSNNYLVLDETPFVLSGGVASERAVGNRKMRQLLLSRARVYELWPAKDSGSVASSSSQGAALDKRYTTVIPEENLIRDEVRTLYNRSNPKPNMAQAEQAIREAMPGATRGVIRKVLKEEEFARQRRSAGNSGPRRR